MFLEHKLNLTGVPMSNQKKAEVVEVSEEKKKEAYELIKKVFLEDTSFFGLKKATDNRYEFSVVDRDFYDSFALCIHMGKGKKIKFQIFSSGKKRRKNEPFCATELLYTEVSQEKVEVIRETLRGKCESFDLFDNLQVLDVFKFKDQTFVKTGSSSAVFVKSDGNTSGKQYFAKYQEVTDVSAKIRSQLI